MGSLLTDSATINNVPHKNRQNHIQYRSVGPVLFLCITINFENPNLRYYLLNHLDVFLKKLSSFYKKVDIDNRYFCFNSNHLLSAL